MKFLQLSLVGIALALLVAVSVTSAGKDKEKGKGGKGKNMTCKGEPIEGMVLMKGLKECSDELAPPTEEPLPEDKEKRKEAKRKQRMEMNKNNCVDVCAKKKQGILSDDGTLNEAGLEAFVKSVLPEKAQTEMIDALKACYNDNFKSTTPSMENDCESYKEFSKCSRHKFFKVCEIKRGGGRGKKGGKGKKDRDEGGQEDQDADAEPEPTSPSGEQ